MKRIVSALYIFVLPLIFLFGNTGCNEAHTAVEIKENAATGKIAPETKVSTNPILDTADYNKKMLALSNYDTTGKWPAKTQYPLAGALLPNNRIIAFYGNLFSKRMGILGEIPKDSMLKKLQEEVANWQAADTAIRTIPALHYVAITAQGAPGKDGKHRLRMPFHQIDTILKWANEIKALVFVDIQVGHSSVKDEVPPLEKYLKMPQVHLGIDPEFSLKNGEINYLSYVQTHDKQARLPYISD